MPASRADTSGYRQNGAGMSQPILTWTKHHSFSIILIFLSLTAPHLNAALTVKELFDSITIHLGDGSNVSYLALVEPSINPKAVIYAWHYDEPTNPNTPPRTGLDLYNSVHEETAGSPWELSYSTDAIGLITSFSVGPTNSRVVDPYANPGPVWTYWIQGGSEYVEYGDNDTTFTFMVGNSLIVSPAYWDTRYISNGSYDVWTITRFSYTGAPSDTHAYTDISGQTQTVTYGTYEGSAPALKTPPTVVSSRILTDGKLEIVFATIEGALYQIEEQESLNPNGWQIRGESFTATSSQKIFTFPTDNPSKKGFFRLRRKE